MKKLPAWFSQGGGSSGQVKKDANKQEERLSKRLQSVGGKRQPVSGAFWDRKGDVIVGEYALGDAKGTKNKSLTVTSLMWEKICKEAMEMGKQIPFLQLEMNGIEPLVVLSENDFLLFMELLNQGGKC